MPRHVLIDFETFYNDNSKKKYDPENYSIRTLGNRGYCRDERFDAYMVSVCDGSESWVGHPSELSWSALDGCTLLAHNAGFDSEVYRELVRRKLAPKLNITWNCTANMTAALAQRRALSDAAQHFLGITVDKSARSDANGRRWPEGFPGEERGCMLEYARQDAVLGWKLWEKCSPQWSDFERRISALTLRQQAEGVCIDVDKAERYVEILARSVHAIETNLPWTDRGRKPASPIGVAEQCRASGIDCPPLIKDDEEGYDAWVRNNSVAHPWVRMVGQWRRVNRLKTVVEKMLALTDNEGGVPTMFFSLLYFGAHTGRWSGGGGGYNIQNQLKEAVLLDAGYIPLTEDELAGVSAYRKDNGLAYPGGIFVVDLRSLLIPKPGHKFIIADLSQIEARVVQWLAGNTALLDLIARSGMSVYEAAAVDWDKWSGGPGTMKETHQPLYALTKAQVLGLGFGCGIDRFVGVAYMMAGLRITEEESERAVSDFRRTNPLLCDFDTGLWGRLDRDLRAAVGGNYQMVLPSGRTMNYEDVRLTRKIVVDKKTKLPKSKTELSAIIGFQGGRARREGFYGGKLTENATQAVAREIFAHGLLQMEDAGLLSKFTAHDEGIAEVPIDQATEGRAEIMRCLTAAPEWAVGLPIGCEAKIADCYKK